MLITIPNRLDSRTGRLVSRFENEDSTGKYTAARYVAQCVLSCGIQPSYAFCSAPIAQYGTGARDQRGLKVALKQDGPAGRIRLLTRAEISYEEYSNSQQALLLTGWLVSYAHNFGMGEDSVIMQVFDDKIILDKFTVSGCLVYDPYLAKYYWDLKRPCIFNFMGWPNFLDTPLGPCFAPTHRYGYKDSFKASAISDAPALDTTEPAKGKAFFQARSADCDDACKYLRLVHSLANRYRLPAMPVDVGLTQIPWYVQWPETLGNLDGFTKRKLKHESMQGPDGKGLGLGQALQQIARKAGAYDLYMKPLSNFLSEISFCDLNPGRDTGMQILLPDYDPGIRNCTSSMVIKEGHIVESATDYYHEDCIQGDAPSVEMALVCKGNPAGTSPDGGVYGDLEGLIDGLEPAWSKEDDALARAYVAQNQGAGPAYPDFEEAMRQAMLLYPFWLCAYRCKNSFSPWDGTKWSGMWNGGRCRFKPHLNTGYQMDSHSPQNWQPRQIVFEYYNDPSVEIQDASMTPEAIAALPDPAWVPFASGMSDGLTLTADSAIFILNGARGQARDTWAEIIHKNAHGDDIGSKVDHVIRRPIRACAIALEADWSITGRKGQADPNNTAARVNGAFRYCWRVSSPPGDYQELLRRGDDFPVGKANFPGTITTAFPAKCTTGNELFTDRVDENTGLLPDHSDARLRDMKRIAYYAKVRIPKLCPSLRPGQTISIEGDKTIPCKTVIKSVSLSMVGTTSDPNENPAVPDTWIEAGPPDFAVLMPNEGKGMAVSAPSESGYVGPSTPQTSGNTSGGNTTSKKPSTTDETGGKSQTQETTTTGGASKTGGDEYADNPSGLGGTDVKKAGGSTSDETRVAAVKQSSDEKRTSTRGSSGSSSWQSEEGSGAAGKGAANGGAGAADKGLHQKYEKKKATQEAARAQRQSRTPDAGFAGFIGKPSSGSMTQWAEEHRKDANGNLQRGFVAQTTSDIRGGMASIANTRAADHYDNANYKSTPRDNNMGTFGAIARATNRGNKGVEAFRQHAMNQAEVRRQQQPQEAMPVAPKPPPDPSNSDKGLTRDEAKFGE